MTARGIVRVWLVDGVVRHVEPADATTDERVAEAAESTVDRLGPVPMVAVVDLPVDGSEAVVRSVDRLHELVDSGPAAEAIAPALAHALAIRPGRPVPLTIDAPALALLAVRLRSRGIGREVASTAASLASTPIQGFDAIVESLRLDGLVRSRGEAGRISLTPAGAARLELLMAEATDGVGRSRVEVIYQEFLPVNREFLSAVSALQSGSRINGDVAVLTLRSLVDRTGPMLVSLSGMLPRFMGYLPRFDRALGRAEHRPEWLDSPVCDSVHTVWFELHEHLLAALGRTRTEEH